MEIAPWILGFIVLSGLCAWIALGNGSETMAGIVTLLLLGADISRWPDQSIRVFAGLTWVLLAIWFVLGLFEPGLRP